MGIKLLASADLHLGRSSSAISAEEYSLPSSRAWSRMVDYAIEEDLDAVILAGDLVDRDNHYFEALSSLEDGFERLNRADIPVVLVSGNHDFQVLPALIGNERYNRVHLIGLNGRWQSISLELKNGEVSFTGWSFPSAHYRDNPLDSFHPPLIRGDTPAIGLLHGDLGSFRSDYGPFGLQDLEATGIQIWVLGHMHKPELVRADHPLILYPGSPQALNPRETGPHGPSLIEIDNGRISSRMIPLSPVRYETIDVHLRQFKRTASFLAELEKQVRSYAESLGSELQDIDELILDVRIRGTTSDPDWVEQQITHAELYPVRIAGTRITLRTLQNRCESDIGNLEQLARETSPAGILARALVDLENGVDSDLLRTLKADLQKRILELNAHSTYHPLKMDPDAPHRNEYLRDPDNPVNIRELLLTECHKFLAALIKTRDI